MNNTKKISKTRQQYILKLINRIIILIFCILIAIFKPNNYLVLNNFFKEFSILHIMWLIWIIEMIIQIIPKKNKLALGSQKLFANHFRPITSKINYKALKNYIISTTKSAYKVLIIWTLLIIIIGILYYNSIINNTSLFIISVIFYVCDLICVLIWCPFRLIIKNKCCTTCRIFNWDHLMMFTPLIFINSFFSNSLILVAFIAWLEWELCILIYPERFWEITNIALKCSECTDKLCTQYCQKLKK